MRDFLFGFSAGIAFALLLHLFAQCEQATRGHPALVECDTDTDCMRKNGGDGGPAPRRAL